MLFYQPYVIVIGGCLSNLYLVGLPLGSPCDEASACSGGPFSYCGLDGVKQSYVCTCKDGYILSSKTQSCIPRLHSNETGVEFEERCDDKGYRCVFDLECRGGVCSCPAGKRRASVEEANSEPYNYQLCRPVEFKLGLY